MCFLVMQNNKYIHFRQENRSTFKKIVKKKNTSDVYIVISIIKINGYVLKNTIFIFIFF